MTTTNENAPYCRGFGPMVDAGCTHLVLGSMPGVASLQKQQYYGHPRNRFWPLMARFCTPTRPAPEDYAERLAMLRTHHIALWDSITACMRAGSLDTAIREVQPSDIAGLLAQYPGITTICCNGAKSYATFCKHNRALLGRPDLRIFAMPSTSPANARWTLDALYEAWRVAFW